MNLQITEVLTADQIKIAEQVAEDSFSTTPDATLDEWLSFPEMLAQINQSRGLCLLAYEKDKPVGMIYAQQESPVNGKEGLEKWVVIIAAVTPEATGKGIGQELLSKMEMEVKNRGGVKMFIFTNKDDERVINFYKKNGYEDAGWIKDYQYGKGNSAVFLMKYL